MLWGEYINERWVSTLKSFVDHTEREWVTGDRFESTSWVGSDDAHGYVDLEKELASLSIENIFNVIVIHDDILFL